MECEEEEKSLSAREILSEARRKLLKYQRKKPIDHEEIEEFYMNDHDQCPDCNVLIIESFVCIDYNEKIFQCRNCKSYFIPEVEMENTHKRRKTQ